MHKTDLELIVLFCIGMLLFSVYLHGAMGNNNDAPFIKAIWDSIT